MHSKPAHTPMLRSAPVMHMHDLAAESSCNEQRHFQLVGNLKGVYVCPTGITHVHVGVMRRHLLSAWLLGLLTALITPAQVLVAARAAHCAHHARAGAGGDRADVLGHDGGRADGGHPGHAVLRRQRRDRRR